MIVHVETKDTLDVYEVSRVSLRGSMSGLHPRVDTDKMSKELEVGDVVTTFTDKGEQVSKVRISSPKTRKAERIMEMLQRIDSRDVNEIIGVMRHNLSPAGMAPMASYVYNEIIENNLTAEDVGL